MAALYYFSSFKICKIEKFSFERILRIRVEYHVDVGAEDNIRALQTGWFETQWQKGLMRAEGEKKTRLQFFSL